MAKDTIVHRLGANARTKGNQPALFTKRDGSWCSTTWSEFHDRVRLFAGALLELGYEAGDAVVIMGNNSEDWVVADVAAMMVRGVPAGIYQTCTPEQVTYIAKHAEAKVFVIEDDTFWTERVEPALDELDVVQRFVLMSGAERVEHERVVSFDDFLATGEGKGDAVDARIDEIELEDLATLIYTSGTTGPPKGVMLSHLNLAHTAKEAEQLIGGLRGPEDCNISYLPLSHIAEQMFTIHLPITAGSKVYFCDDMLELKDYLPEVRPTYFLGVPRVWEKFKSALESRFDEATGFPALVIRWARFVGLRLGYEKLATGELSGFGALQYLIADRLFYSKLKGGLGLDRLRIAVTGAAPIGRDVLEFFLSVGIPIHEVYGQSEGSGPSTFNLPKPGGTKLGTAGLPFPKCEVKIAPDGEIIVRGPNVFMGYYKNPKATAETLIELDDGHTWLHSGDIGEIDSDGFLKITDRKKDLIITAGGKNVAPQNIEKLMRKIDGISQAVVIGDRRKFLSALLTLDPERAPALAEEHGWPADLGQLAEAPDFLKYVDAEVAKANKELARYQSIRKFTIIPTDFTVEGGELTPTQKIKRRVVNEKYGDEIEAFYEGLS